MKTNPRKFSGPGVPPGRFSKGRCGRTQKLTGETPVPP